MNREAAIPVEDAIAELAPKRRFEAYPDYRDSGIEGIQAVPAHWPDKPLKYVASANAHKLADATDPNYELEYVDIGNVSLIDGVTSTETYRFENAPSRARRRVQPGDTIISTVRTYLKAVARIVNPSENLVVSTGFAVLHAGPARPRVPVSIGAKRCLRRTRRRSFRWRELSSDKRLGPC